MIYTVKRFSSDDDEKKGSGLGGKLLLGAGLAAGAFGAAKTGMLGSGLMKSANQAWARGGSMIGGKLGNKMIQSGASGVGSATYAKNLGEASKNLAKGQTITTGMKQEALKAGKEARQGILDKFLG